MMTVNRESVISNYNVPKHSIIAFLKTFFSHPVFSAFLRNYNLFVFVGIAKRFHLFVAS